MNEFVVYNISVTPHYGGWRYEKDKNTNDESCGIFFYGITGMQ